jgi:hypothetical protein
MLLEQPLSGPQRRPGGPGAPLVLVPAAASRPRVVAPTPETGAVEAAVLDGLLHGELVGPSLLEAIAERTACALQRNAAGGDAPSAEQVRGVAARVATGLAVALLQSDLADRIAARLEAEAPFAEGWRSCPE